MTDKVRKVIKLPEGRLCYAYLSKPKTKPPRPDGSIPEPKYETAVLLDPSNPAHAKTIAEIKAEAQRLASETPELAGTPLKKLVLGFGNGDKKAVDDEGERNPTYAAYEGMFYVNTSSATRPLIGDRSGHEIGQDNAQFPYSGCYANVKITLFPWHHVPTKRKGISVDLRSVQFVRDGEAFGRGSLSAETEFEPLDEGAETPVATADDWD